MWLILEAVLALALVSTLFSYIFPLYRAQQEQRESERIDRYFENFTQALRTSFLAIRDASVSACGGYVGNCLGTLPIPSRIEPDGSGGMRLIYTVSSSFPSRSALVSKLDSLYKNTGCFLSSQAGNTVVFSCFHFTVPAALTFTLNPNIPPSFDLYLQKPRGVSISRRVDMSDFYSLLLLETKKLHSDISYLLKEYHLRRRVEEANNPCQPGGGLHSTDDVYIPWVMQAYTANPDALCNTSTTGSCSCTNIDWSGVNQDTQAVNLSPYATSGYPNDAFGFKVCVRALVDDGNNSLSPPNPQPNYPLRPPYSGYVFSTDRANCSDTPGVQLGLRFVYVN